ncbi:hypothetical protein DFH08DRAFT_711185 [Mycena albidolilacea]|uniref:Uncharacterized protein n=1 Tax=Mycena albidolilacea TaxID=1033008 RepID=A0AAD7EH83_9AGAR|nr:hypothetical protein DFH08DRAFT_711185 [Mycena albidolilacea]
MIILPFLALYILAQARGCVSRVSNRTIDDFNGDEVTGVVPVYIPANRWNVKSNCTACHVQPQQDQAIDNTWHDTTVPAGTTYSVTLEFTGTAIYFFGIVPNSLPKTQTHVNLAFSLDGASAGTYVHTPDSTSNTILYSVPLFAKDRLSNEPHTLVAQAQSSSLLIFDFALYTCVDCENCVFHRDLTVELGLMMG